MTVCPGLKGDHWELGLTIHDLFFLIVFVHSFCNMLRLFSFFIGHSLKPLSFRGLIKDERIRCAFPTENRVPSLLSFFLFPVRGRSKVSCVWLSYELKDAWKMCALLLYRVYQ